MLAEIQHCFTYAEERSNERCFVSSAYETKSQQPKIWFSEHTKLRQIFRKATSLFKHSHGEYAIRVKQIFDGEIYRRFEFDLKFFDHGGLRFAWYWQEINLRGLRIDSIAIHGIRGGIGHLLAELVVLDHTRHSQRASHRRRSCKCGPIDIPTTGQALRRGTWVFNSTSPAAVPAFSVLSILTTGQSFSCWRLHVPRRVRSLVTMNNSVSWLIHFAPVPSLPLLDMVFRDKAVAIFQRIRSGLFLEEDFENSLQPRFCLLLKGGDRNSS